MMRLLRAIEHLKQPEYTGANRCTPCTVMNLVLGIVLTSGIAVAADFLFGWRPAIFFGTVAFSTVVISIYLRGYLVPGTPEITAAYFPEWLLSLFGKSATQMTTDSEVDFEKILKRANIITECEHENDVCLTTDFRNEWLEQMEELQTENAVCDCIRNIVGITNGVSCFDHGSSYIVLNGSHLLGEWESRSAFISDIASGMVLQSYLPTWSSLDIEHRSSILKRLRTFLDNCPSCDGDIIFNEKEVIDSEEVEFCCQTTNVIVAECERCGTTLFKEDVSNQ